MLLLKGPAKPCLSHISVPIDVILFLPVELRQSRDAFILGGGLSLLVCMQVVWGPIAAKNCRPEQPSSLALGTLERGASLAWALCVLHCIRSLLARQNSIL